MCNDCSICYDENAKCKLVCGHVFHHKCIKKWYMIGNNDTCPMCRNNIYFKGIQRDQWDDERYENRMTEIYQEAVSSLIKDSNDDLLCSIFFNNMLVELETIYVRMKEEYVSHEEMEFFLANPDLVSWSKEKFKDYTPPNRKQNRIRKQVRRQKPRRRR